MNTLRAHGGKLSFVILAWLLGIAGMSFAGTMGGQGAASSSGGTPADPIVPADGTQNITGALTTSGGIAGTTGDFSGAVTSVSPTFTGTTAVAAMTASGNVTWGNAATSTTGIYGPISNPGAGTPTGCATAGAVCVSDAAGLEAVGGLYAKEGTVTTTDATQTTVLSYTPADETGAGMRWTCVGARNDRDMVNFYFGGALSVKRNGGTTTIITNAQTDQEQDAAWSFTVDASSPDVHWRATGAAATTINWRCRIDEITVAP